MTACLDLDRITHPARYLVVNRRFQSLVLHTWMIFCAGAKFDKLQFRVLLHHSVPGFREKKSAVRFFERVSTHGWKFEYDHQQKQ